MDAAVAYFQEALETCTDQLDFRISILSNLGNALVSRYNSRGHSQELDAAISYHEEAVTICPMDHPDRAGCLNNLGNALRYRFTGSGDMLDLDACTAHFRNGVSLSPIGTPLRAYLLTNLSNALWVAFQRNGELPVLDEAILHGREALQLQPPGHPWRGRTLTALGNALCSRAKVVGSHEDLQESITSFSEAVGILQCTHTMRFAALSNLSSALSDRFGKARDTQDLRYAIELQQEALALCKPGHSSRDTALNNFATLLLTRFGMEGDMGDLNGAIGHLLHSLELSPGVLPEQSATLNNLGGALHTRFFKAGDTHDLNTAIECHQKALRLRTGNHPDRTSSLNNLGGALQSRFAHTGDMADLNAAIEYHQEGWALDSAKPTGNVERSGNLLNLACALWTRYRDEGNPSDLDTSATYLQDALRLLPPEHSIRFYCLSHLGDVHQTKFGRDGKISELDQAVAFYEKALDLCPPGHLERALSLNNLAFALQNRAQHYKNLSDATRAVGYHREALELRPLGDPERATSLSNLAIALRNRFDITSEPEDLRDAVLLARQAVELYPYHHPRRSDVVNTVAMTMLHEYWKLSDESSDDATIKDIIRYLQEAAEAPASPVIDRLHACCNWVDVSDLLDYTPTLLTGCTTLLDLLDLSASRAQSLETRHSQLSSDSVLRRATDLIHDAASYAIKESQNETAAMFLERGRSILLTQLGRFRTALDDVQAADQELAIRFTKLSLQLDKAIVGGESLSSGQQTFEDNISRCRRLTTEWNDTVKEIRALEGLDSFLRPTPFDKLQHAADYGPVIMINVSRIQSDALIITKDKPPHLVPLPEAPLSFVERLHQDLSNATKQSVMNDRTIIQTLREVWRTIVSPITQELQSTLGIPKHSRVWWCPSGVVSRFPLHAAGPYRPKEANFLDTYISSYTPTLEALIRARHAPPPTSLAHQMLVVGQPNTPGQTPLEMVKTEVELLRERFPTATFLNDKEGTHDAVLAAIGTHSWVHLSCHGHINHSRPFRSHFSLHDSPLYLLDLVQQGLPNAQFAMLSACHSAANAQGTPDEALHLAAALQFAGFKSVVGTLWAMADCDGPTVTKEIYEQMNKGGDWDCTMAARALHRTVKSLRLSKGIPTIHAHDEYDK
ncbi:hypothetical protein FRB99_005496 [Tulasnella sp. 403]|nr:hypothetical protein FRB99_005496 [Tulasnella sp. 403]